jgi:hypothetical protein
MGERKFLALVLSILIIASFAVQLHIKEVSALFTPPIGWNTYQAVLIPSRMDGFAVVYEPFERYFEPEPGKCYSTNEIRVIAPDGVTEIASQVYDVKKHAVLKYITSCKVAFLVDAPANTNVTYYIVYNNPSAAAPVYDGLRSYVETAGDTYSVNVTQLGVEKNYARIIWTQLMDLYSNGKMVTWPGGPPLWELSQINLGTMWSDPWGGGWFGSGKALSLLESGPIFAEFNYSESYSTDLWGLFTDYNVSTSMILRVYYQPDLNPLVKFDKTYKINTNLANYTISPGAYLDFRLANSSSLAIYRDFTYNEGWFGTTDVPAETAVWPSIWYDPWAVYGWWSYNGTRADSTDKPEANIGLIPTYSRGSVSPGGDADYGLSVSQSIDPDDHHCTMWMNGKYNAVAGGHLDTGGYIVTNTPVNVNIEPAMNEEAAKLRNPLQGIEWENWKYIVLTESSGVARSGEPVDLYVTFDVPITDPEKEVRVLDPCGHEIPSQVWNATYSGGKCVSANVVFLADCPASSSVTYTILYNNPYATTPIYDGLRVYTEVAGDTYSVNVTKVGVEKNYARIIWTQLMDLYSNGKMVTWPGGPSGWEFSQMNLGTLWSDAWDNPWFGANKSLSLLHSGPVFAEFNYTEAGASDLWGLVVDYNVTTTSIVRIYYQANLNPLVMLKRSFNIETNLANYTLKGPFYFDLNLANSTSQAIYKNFTYSEGWFGTTCVPVETTVWKTIWYDPYAEYGWWSYNGTRADSTDKPAANIGLIPTYSGGSLPPTADGDYGLSVVQQIENDDHHCSQLINGKYNGVKGDHVQVNSYIFTYGPPIDTSAQSVMDDEATRLRNPMAALASSGVRDVATTLLKKSKTVVGVGWNLVVNVTIANQGALPECFCIELYANTTVVQSVKVEGVSAGVSKIITIKWNTTGYAKGNYSIAVVVGTVPYEADTVDNSLLDGAVKVTIPGNLNTDNIVDIYDAIILSNAFNSKPTSPTWNPNADINGDQVVDIYDAILLANAFNKSE